MKKRQRQRQMEIGRERGTKRWKKKYDPIKEIVITYLFITL